MKYLSSYFQVQQTPYFAALDRVSDGAVIQDKHRGGISLPRRSHPVGVLLG
jgi:hypothetical protein